MQLTTIKLTDRNTEYAQNSFTRLRTLVSHWPNGFSWSDTMNLPAAQQERKIQLENGLMGRALNEGASRYTRLTNDDEMRTASGDTGNTITRSVFPDTSKLKWSLVPNVVKRIVQMQKI